KQPSTEEKATTEQPSTEEKATTEQPSTEEKATTKQRSTEEKATTEQPSTEETTTKPADSTQSESSSNEDKESNKNLTDDNKTTNDSVTSDTKAIASKMNEPTVSDDSSVTDKKAYTDDVVSNLNVDTDNKEAITNAVSNDIDLENASQDEINNAIVAEALKTDFTNSDYGFNSPFMTLAALSPKAASTTNATNDSNLGSRAITTFAADTSAGRDVSNKVNVTNLRTSINNNENNNTYHASTYETVHLKSDYTLDNDVHENDYFTINYGTNFRPGGLDYPKTPQNLYNNQGGLVATGTYDPNTNSTTYKFTNYVDQYENIRGNFDIITSVKKDVVKNSGSYSYNPTVAGESLNKQINVIYGHDSSLAASAAVTSVEDDTNIEHVTVYYNEVGRSLKSTGSLTNAKITLNNATFDKNTANFKVYRVTNNAAFTDSYVPNLQYATQIKVPINFNSNNQAVLTLPAKGLDSRYIITYDAKQTENTKTVTHTLEYTMNDGNKIYSSDYGKPFKLTIDNVASSSTASGDNPMYSLGDRVWNDVNHNGIQDDNDQGIQGVYVTLKDSNNRELQRVTTDATGHYQFDNLQNGTYTVEFSIPKDRNGKDYTLSPANNTNDDTVDSDGELDSARNIVTATGIINDSDNMTVDTGFYLEQPTYKLGDYVWQDTNDNGIQDDGDTGISGVTVTLTNNETNETTTTTTDATGKYEFNGLSNGTYTVTFTTPENMVDAKTGTTTSDKDSNPSTSTVVINNADDMTIDKGYVPTYNLGDRVWEDTDKNGIQDAGEKGFANVGVELRDSNNKVIDTATTDSNGNYLFTNVKNGTYTVVFQTPDGYTATLANVGNDDAIDSNGTTTIATINGADNLTVDSGFYKDTPVPTPNKYNVGDRVWNDVNRNGIQDDGESGIGGVNVILKKDGRTIGNTVTDNQGNYGFYDLDEGEYTIEFIDPDGYTETTSNAPGSTTENDSNGPVVRIELHNDDNSIDYGLYKDTQSGYEITVEDVSYKNVVRENKELPKNSIQLVQQGEDGRDRVFYKELGYNPDLTGIDDSKLLEEDGYYWQEVRRDNLYSPKDAIIEYNLDNNEGVTNITYNPTTNQFKVEYSDREPKYIDGPNPKDGKDGQSVTTVTERGTKGDQTGSYIRTYYINADGSRGDLISESFVADGKDGENGKDGKDGENGKDGKDGENGKDGQSVTTVTERGTKGDQTGSYIRTYYINADGSRGDLISESFVADGKDGENGKDGKDGKDGENGKDGQSVTTVTERGTKGDQTGSYIRTYYIN
ncbi:SdrD B-like domain-containing protein, partial [Staphylococcus hominis]|uniref:SdrD B-like domain-containing protein n=2 Tax=Staphylococcus hominis TaxID=1290 RepID=UPI001643F1F2